MRQEAPFPDALATLVARLHYRDNWSFRLADADRGQGSSGMTLIIDIETVNSYPPHEPLRVRHFMPVPPAAYDERSWQRWLFEQVLLVERHEAMEFFRIGRDGWNGQRRPYAPSHGPGNDPYMVREVGTETDQRTSFRGNVS